MNSEIARSDVGGGVLYIVATPIGNLEDITARAERVLASVDFIAAEDTRHSGRLLQALAIRRPLVALHDHNERERAASVLDRIVAGESAALISDAGTPLISDPGYILVRQARERGVRVVPVPGVSALTSALSVAGLPTDRFTFIGFLPAKRSGRQAALDSLKHDVATLVFYESPHRIVDMIEDVVAVFGEHREVAITRELTKTFESFYGGAAAGVLDQLQADPNATKGEFVVMVQGAQPRSEEQPGVDVDKMLRLLCQELPVKKAARIGAELTGVSRNDLYQRALALKDE
ncbi:16S rRNA (cytidine(1402)-2'-O)-methyltransferase [Marinobacter zhejiangensis]|uniref:Ribosomal RNA small subunit methyltransferase I n=1 Tax=Marinobacter zhejiangensis TaxID=488535 RepID=A0A1I4TAA9_9GAMM|nr:16S rRNA (cytidine(1402)-2'-O)-methyltransferase [Marinobacter zhejiangensis]SFM73728.1 16S rRNA (cytidine1402-2'-O)-methyltransferase [Marinobacter zhejiangensis]